MNNILSEATKSRKKNSGNTELRISYRWKKKGIALAAGFRRSAPSRWDMHTTNFWTYLPGVRQLLLRQQMRTYEIANKETHREGEEEDREEAAADSAAY